MSAYVVDRFEGTEWAVLESPGGKTFNVPRQWLPEMTREGDVLEITKTSTGAVTFDINTQAHDERLAAAARSRENLVKGPKGDISL